MIHLQKSVAWLCIGLVVFVAVTATAAGEIAALLAPLWLLCVDLASRLRRRLAARRDERLLSLLALVPSRAPPALALARQSSPLAPLGAQPTLQKSAPF